MLEHSQYTAVESTAEYIYTYVRLQLYALSSWAGWTNRKQNEVRVATYPRLIYKSGVLSPGYLRLQLKRDTGYAGAAGPRRTREADGHHEAHSHTHLGGGVH